MHDVVPVPPRTLNPASSVQVAMHPIHPMLVPFPIVCFVGTLLTDLAYWKTAEMMWANFSAWLLVAGLVMGSLAAIAGLVDFLGNRLIRARAGMPHVSAMSSCWFLRCSTASSTAAMPGHRWSRPA